MKWDREEEIILVNLYFKVQRISCEEKKILVESVSNFLNHRADALEIDKDIKFRNVTGIEMKLQNIEYIVSNGEKGLACFSAMDKEVFEFSIKYPERFNEEYKNIIAKYDINNIYNLNYANEISQIYEKRFAEGEKISSKYDNLESSECIKSYSAKDFIQNKTCPDKYKEIYEILDSNFTKGLNTNSSIQLKKFRIKSHGIELPDDDELKNILSLISIDYGDGLYMSATCAISDINLLQKLLNYVLDAFNKGKHILYIQNIYRTFKEDLIYTNIYNTEILKSLFKFYFENEFYIKRSYIADSFNADISVDEEIEEILINSEMPIQLDELSNLLLHIPSQKIRSHIRNNVNIVRVAQSTYWHITYYDITDEEKKQFKKIIIYALNDGFVSAKKLFKIVNAEMADYTLNNAIDNYMCLLSLAKYYYNNEFTFKESFVCRLGHEVSVSLIVKKFISSKDEFNMKELFEYLDENDLPNRYDLFEESIGNGFIRINKDSFISKDNFSVTDGVISKIESEVEKYVKDGIVAISGINSYVLFPNIGCVWNEFLLESIIENFGMRYSIIRLSKTFNQVNCVIVEKHDQNKTPEDILVKVLSNAAKDKQFCSQEEVLDYLCENGFIARRRLKNIDEIYNKLKLEVKGS